MFINNFTIFEANSILMKKSTVFKTLVDILFVLHFIGLFFPFIAIPFGTITLLEVNIKLEDWTVFYVLIGLYGLVGYIIFLRGLYYLRKMANSLVKTNCFSDQIIANLKNAGNNFLITGIMFFVSFAILWLYKLYNGKIEFIYDNLMIPIFLSIIGLFFIIQSNTLLLAKNINDENELTV